MCVLLIYLLLKGTIMSLLNRVNPYLLLVIALAVFALNFTYETLNISGLLDTDQIFAYANILLAALIPVVLIGLGFALARFVISFVQRVFNSLG